MTRNGRRPCARSVSGPRGTNHTAYATPRSNARWTSGIVSAMGIACSCAGLRTERVGLLSEAMCAALHVRMSNDNTIGRPLYMHSSMCGRSGRSVDSPGPPDRRAQVVTPGLRWLLQCTAQGRLRKKRKGLCELAIRAEPTSADWHRTHAPIENLPLFFIGSNAKIFFFLESSFINHSMQRRPVLAQRPSQGP